MSVTIRSYLASEHKNCDEDFAASEDLAANGKWDEAAQMFEKFANETLLHFRKEEEIMFVALEDATGMRGGPTEVMRMEHVQVRNELQELKNSMENKDKNRFLGGCETLNLLIQQHNAKEEQILYNMADSVLADQAEALIGKMQEL